MLTIADMGEEACATCAFFFLVGGNAAIDINVINQLQETFNQAIYTTKTASAVSGTGTFFLCPLVAQSLVGWDDRVVYQLKKLASALTRDTRIRTASFSI